MGKHNSTSKVSKAAKTPPAGRFEAKPAARKAAKKVARKTLARRSRREPQGGTPSIKKGGGPVTRPRVRKATTPVEDAAREGVTIRYVDGVAVADDADVVRIAKSIADHRKGLMDRLAK